MRNIFPSLFPKNNLDAFIAAAAGFFIIWLYTRHSGIGISPDSVTYLSVARNFRAQGVLFDYTDSPVIIFPVFYPVFLTLFEWITGSDPMVFAPLLNAGLFALLIYTTGWIMESFSSSSKWFKQIILGFLVLSPGLLEVYSMMWSETLFILLLLFFMIALRHYLDSPSLKSLLFPACVTATACITRFAGVTLIATAGLFLLFDRRTGIKKKIIHILVFGITASSLLLINLIRNAVESGTLTGLREQSLTSLYTNLVYCGLVFCDWLPLPKGHSILAFSLTLFLIGGFLFLIRQNIRNSLSRGFEQINLIFFLVYLVFIIGSASFSRYELINSRLLSPLFISFLLGGTYWLIPVCKKSWARNQWLTITGATLLTVLFQLNQGLADYENYDGIKDAGIPGYTEDNWAKDSEIVNYLKTNRGMFKPGYTLYSNTNDAFYFFTGRQSELLPHRIIPPELREFSEKQGIYLIWFDDGDNQELIGLQDVFARKKMTLLKKFNNGSIYISQP